MILRIKLTKEKFDQSLFFKGAKGTYIDCSLLENKNGTDEYGNDGMIVQDIGKERREKGEKGPIVGNWKYVGERPTGARHPAAPAARPAAETRPSGATQEAPDVAW